MPWQPGQSGNPEGSPKGKPWAGALRRAIAEADRDKLLEIAKAVLDKAAEGDMAAVKEIGDRMDGKPAQSIDLGSDPTRPLLAQVARVIVDPSAGNNTPD